MKLICFLGLMFGIIMFFVDAKNKNKTGRILDLTIIGAGFIFFMFFHDDYDLYTNSEVAGVLIFYMCIFIFIRGIILYKDRNKHENKNNNRDTQRVDPKEKAAAETLYNRIKSSGYDIKDKEVLKVLSSTYNKTQEEIVRLYKLGEECIKEDKIKAEEEKIKAKEKEKAAEIKRDYGLIENEKNKTKVVGKLKYVNYLNESEKIVSAPADLYKILSDSYRSGAYNAMHQKETDPYIWAGMANGIAGPAAAMMTAYDIEKENARKRELGKEIAKNSLEKSDEFLMLAAKEGGKSAEMIKKITNLRKKIQSALINKDEKELIDLIDFEVINIKLTKTNFIEISFKCHLKDIKILDKAGVLDGSFVVNAIDSESNVVATGYCSGGNIYIDPRTHYFSTNRIGFSDEEQTILLAPNDDFDTELLDEYDFSFEPINLWVIEKKWK